MKKGQSIDYFKYPESDVIVDHVYKRFRKGLGTNMFVIGLPGTGKSSTCQRLGELITEKIHGENRITEKNIVDNLLDTLEFVRNCNVKGECLIIEEVSVLFPSTRAMSKENVAIGKIFDTIRKKQIILVTNAPLLKHIDSHMRALGNVLIETKRIIKTKQIVVSHSLILQTNPRSGKTYFHKFVRKGRDVFLIYTRMPNQEVWDRYEEEKDKFMGRLYELLKWETEDKREKEEKKIVKKKQDFSAKDLSPREKQVFELVIVKRLSQTDAGRALGISQPRVADIIRRIEKKTGITPTNFRKGYSIMDNKGEK